MGFELFGFVDHAHAAFAEDAEDAAASDGVGGGGGFGLKGAGGLSAFIGGEQGFDLGVEGVVVAAELLESCGPLVGREREDLVKDFAGA